MAPQMTFLALPHLTKRFMLRASISSVLLILIFLFTPGLHNDHSSGEAAGDGSTFGSSSALGKDWFVGGGGGWSVSSGMKDLIRGNVWRSDLDGIDDMSGQGDNTCGIESGQGNTQAGDGWIDMDKDLTITKYDGGLPGYQVFSNLYLVNSVLTSVISTTTNTNKAMVDLPLGPESDEEELELQMDLEMKDRLSNYNSKSKSGSYGSHSRFPEVGYIMSSEKRGVAAGEDRWKIVNQDVGREEIGSRGYRLGGVTYIFNDPPGPDGFLEHISNDTPLPCHNYIDLRSLTRRMLSRHFVLEAFLGATRVLASTIPESISVPIPRRVWFPRSGSDPSWRDDRGENAWFLAHALPSATIEDKNGWDDRNTAGMPLLLEKVVIIDRWAAHSAGGEVGKWAKMNALIPSVSARQSFWEPFRSNVMRSLGVDGQSEVGSKGLPVVVYVDRQKESPKMNQTDHDALVDGLMSLTSVAEVHVARLSAMSKARQVYLMARAQIVISLHGDELFTALWMPSKEGSLVIELFEEGGFIRDFELLATALNHQYIAVQGNKVLTEEKWREAGGTKGDERDTGEISINTELVVRLIEDCLEKHAGFVE
ncbi:uncharacterized protein IL334_001458 [Kwoniella shivajii]|uniref:Uncharacterized protein n=1 Tax=Kwoniella shivajii TaxID=564305 RepID=A0ABZ1CRZ8_9TREE|nr:hypothetical protein IL334_001458 [Kwoniella shivajii]